MKPYVAWFLCEPRSFFRLQKVKINVLNLETRSDAHNRLPGLDRLPGLNRLPGLDRLPAMWSETKQEQMFRAVVKSRQ